MNASDFQVELLQSQPFFGGISDEIVEIILARSSCVNVARGEAFCREGDSATTMYVLEKGRVSVTKESEGKECLLRELEAGECFGEMALMDMRPRSASVIALEDCTAIEISLSTLHHIFSINTEQFALIKMNMGREVCRRLRLAD